MTRSVKIMRCLTAVIIGALFINVVAQSNAYDKFRNRELSNKGYLTEEEEIKLGEQVHQELLKQTRLNQDPGLNNYINGIGQSLARRSERPNLPWRFYVVDDKAVNAFATLGGRVYIHTGLIAATRSESQLASVMGHEIGHIVGRHGLENVKKSQKYGTFAGLATIAGAILGGQGGAQLGQMAGNMIAGGYLMKHSRDAEREADFLGLYDLKATGYNTGGMVEMFEILASLNPNQLGSIMSSHPPAAERASNTRREIDQHLQGTDQRGVSTTNNFQQIKSGVRTAPAPAASSGRRVRPRN
jgi:beta-barrel assembly-enhancing protease